MANEEQQRIARLRRINVIAVVKSSGYPVTLQYITSILRGPHWNYTRKARCRSQSNATYTRSLPIRDSVREDVVRRDAAFLTQQGLLKKEEILHRVPGDERYVKLTLCRVP